MARTNDSLSVAEGVGSSGPPGTNKNLPPSPSAVHPVGANPRGHPLNFYFYAPCFLLTISSNLVILLILDANFNYDDLDNRFGWHGQVSSITGMARLSMANGG